MTIPEPYTFEMLALDHKLFPYESLYSEQKEFVIPICIEDESREDKNNGAITADTEITERQIRELIACYLGTAFPEDVCILSEQTQLDENAECIRYIITACRKVWNHEERRQLSPEQIISRALRIYVPDQSVQNKIRSLADAPEEQLDLLNLYRKDPDRITEEYERIVQKYSGRCPFCGARQIQNGLRREYRFWKCIRSDSLRNRCRFCGRRWKTE